MRGSAEPAGLVHYPLRWRGAFRSAQLVSMLQSTSFPVTPVDCIDFMEPAVSSGSTASNPRLAWLVYGRRLTPAEVSASLSHRKAWAQAFRDGCEWAIIYEDDVVPRMDQFGAFVRSLARVGTSTPTMINLLPAQQVVRTGLVSDAGLGSAVGAVRIRTYTTNAQAYAINRPGLLKLMEFVSAPVVRPPDFPPSVTHLQHFVVERGRLFEVETIGSSTVGDRDEISIPSRLVRWVLRVSGLTYVLAGWLYGGQRNYWRYEVEQRLEHRRWQRRLDRLPSQQRKQP
jgi:hypothetical protein